MTLFESSWGDSRRYVSTVAFFALKQGELMLPEISLLSLVKTIVWHSITLNIRKSLDLNLRKEIFMLAIVEGMNLTCSTIRKSTQSLCVIRLLIFCTCQHLFFSSKHKIVITLVKQLCIMKFGIRKVTQRKYLKQPLTCAGCQLNLKTLRQLRFSQDHQKTPEDPWAPDI